MKGLYLSILFVISSIFFCSGQVVPITNYSVNAAGQVQLSIQGNSTKYYLLTVQHSPTFQWVMSMTMGVDGTMIITEPGGAYSVENYTVTAYDIANPGDWDGDGLNDIEEYNNMPTDAPLNDAFAVDFIDGSTSIPDAETFMALAAVNDVPWAPFLDGQLYVKFGILDRDTPNPKVYFINSNTYTVHGAFWSAIGASVTGDDGSGEIVFNPNTISPNGVIGSYSFNFSFGNAFNFTAVQRTYELLLANMPFITNNMNYFIGQNDENDHLNNFADDFVGSRINVELESDVFADINYIPLHQAEGYGFFRQMNVGETPGSRDIVLYDQLPNSLPRVGGIITSVVQTPLSHVNLRAIQDNVPNAYIANPLSIDSISSLLGSYVHYIVENETFQFHEATLDEVNAWYEALRPTEAQIPERDLSITEITPLSEIDFNMATAFGAKCSNVATMRTFGFPEGTIPDGFGIPFHFYHEFMLYNGFYQEAELMINNPAFINDINFRINRLSIFRESIRDAPMPAWMMQELQEMHDAFPEGTNVRCRSSTNNEDLPGFSGAGLYTSKTHRIDEGHISKTIKQVFASMWTFRAFEERDFSRVDHFMAAMGVLCHPNYDDEESNGVGVGIDPIYGTEGTFYLNTQVGESLVTNPDPNAVPEEILLYQNPQNGNGYLVLNLSSLTPPGQLVMDQIYLDQLREYLTVINEEFAILYGVEGAEGFGMDIEYKVDANGQMVIKQARPWVSFWSDIQGDYDLGVESVVAPESSSVLGSSELITVNVSNNGLNAMSDFDLTLYVDDVFVETMTIDESIEPFTDVDYQFTIPQNFSAVGTYEIKCIVSHEQDQYTNNDTLQTTITKTYLLDGGISLGEINVLCGGDAELSFRLTNYGDTPITSVQFDVQIDGVSLGVSSTSINIPSQSHASVFSELIGVLIDENSEITISLLGINNQQDQNSSNDDIVATLNTNSDYGTITLVINADDFPQETTWDIYDLTEDRLIGSGELTWETTVFSQDFCVNYESCIRVTLYDSFSDGICCAYGEGNFLVLDAEGTIIASNNGDFGSEGSELICLGDLECEITADIEIGHAQNNDGSIHITVDGGTAPYQYSINGGAFYLNSGIFNGLAPGIYDIVVQSALEGCFYETTVEVSTCTLNSVDFEITDASSSLSANGSIVINPTSGTPPFSYSIDGGVTFSSNNTFLNLPFGNYNIVVLDADGFCEYINMAPVTNNGPMSTEDSDIITGNIRMYPNPASDQVVIEFNSASSISDSMNITIFDNLGRTIQTNTFRNQSGGRIVLQIENFAPGNYFVKCSSDTIDKTFKLIKTQ